MIHYMILEAKSTYPLVIMAENSPWTVHFSSMVSPKLTPGQGEDLYPRRRTDLGELETGGGGPAGERNGERARVPPEKLGLD